MNNLKCVCLIAMFITALCVLLCSIQYLMNPTHVMWIHLGVKDQTGRQVINIILFLSALIVMNCGYRWWKKRD
jgi:hypothetical protein